MNRNACTRSRGLAVAGLFAMLLVAIRVEARAWAPVPSATVRGTITAFGGTVLMPGVVVEIGTPAGAPVASTVTDEKGQYRFAIPGGGTFRMATNIDGFYPSEREFNVADGATAVVDFDLRMREFQQTVTVVPSGDAGMNLAETLGRAESIDGRTLAESAMSAGSVAAELRWLPGVATYGREWAIKGGRPNQIAAQVESVQVMDPAAGTSSVQLPGDAVNRIQVMANPYAVEFGRFSSGVVVVSTQRGSDKWRASVNNFLPAFILKRGANPFHPIGIQQINPRVSFGGPIVKSRLFIAQSTQFRYRSGEVSSRAQNERSYTRSLNAFTRLDLIVNPRHVLTGTVLLTPDRTSAATLGAFDPPEVTADLTQRVYRIGVSEKTQLAHSMVLESLVHFTRSRSSVDGHGTGTTMVLAPEENSGIYYGHQHRSSDAWQAGTALSGAVKSPWGQHLLKGGVDVLHVAFGGNVAPRPVAIVRKDGTLTRRLVSGASFLALESTDAAAYLRDRWLVSGRVIAELGLRVERDGVFGRTNAAPRVGLAVALDAAKNMMVRGGWGVFHERTPPLAGAYQQQLPVYETAYATDGSTPLGPAIGYVRTLGEALSTPRSVTWNLAYEQRVSPSLSVRFNRLQRDGQNELVLDVGRRAGGTGWMRLDSAGRSRYRDIEVGAHISRSTVLDLDLSYTHSSSRADLNDAYGYYLNITPTPVARANAFGAADGDAPHRFVARGRLMPRPAWILEVASEVRSGFPYSIVDENLEFVGARNSRRFPRHAVLDASIERRFSIGKAKPWIGAVFTNPLNLYVPADVQRNLASGAFGRVYGAAIRQIRITVRFHK